MGFEINKRIQLFIDELNITPYEFSKRMGNKRPDGLYKLLDLKTKPSPKTLEKIKETYPELNYNWLLTGEGEMKKGEKAKAHLSNEDEKDYGAKESAILDLKKDIQAINENILALSEGMTVNFERLSSGVIQGLKNDLKIIQFIEKLDPDKIATATGKLDAFIEEQEK